MHVAVVAWGLPPCRGSGVYRALALVRGFAAAGARVSALTASRETFLALYGADTSLEAQIPASVQLLRIPFSPNRLWPIIHDQSAVQTKTEPRWKTLERRKDLAIFPEEVYAPWLLRSVQPLLDLHRSDPIDLVVATGNPYVDFEIAYSMWESTGIPFVLDDRDSFLFDVFTGAPTKHHRARRERFLDYAVACREYWSVNPGLATKHSEVAPAEARKFRVVPNGWDPGPVPPAEAIRCHRDAVERPTRFGIVGTVTMQTPLIKILRAWSDFRTGQWQDAEFHVVGSIGFTADSGVKQNRAAATLASAPGVVQRGRVDRDEVWDTYSGLDILVLAARGHELVTSGKIYEYLATGLPIVLVTAPDHDALRVATGYPRLHQAPLGDTEATVRALRSAADDFRNRSDLLAPAQRFGEGFRRDRMLGPAIGRVLEGAK